LIVCATASYIPYFNSLEAFPTPDKARSGRLAYYRFGARRRR
jgi:hypothetical protein